MSFGSPPWTYAIDAPSGLQAGCSSRPGDVVTARGASPGRARITKTSVFRFESGSGAVRLLMSGEDQISTFKEGSEQYPVTMRLLPGQRDNPAALSRLLVPSARLGLVRLDSVAKLERGLGPSRISVAAPSKQAQQAALEMAAKRARVVYFAGLPKHDPVSALDMNQLHYKELAILGAYGATHRQYRITMDYLNRRRDDLAPVVTHRFGLDRIAEAFETIRSGTGLKTVVIP